MSLLQKHPRAVAVLKAVADNVELEAASRPDGHALGLAYSDALETHTAAVVEVSLDEKSGKIKVHHVWAAVDPGIAVQPKNIEAQMEGAILRPRRRAHASRSTSRTASRRSRNFDTYHVLRMNEVPPIDGEGDLHRQRADRHRRSRRAGGGAGDRQRDRQAHRGKRLRQLPMTPERVQATARLTAPDPGLNGTGRAGRAPAGFHEPILGARSCSRFCGRRCAGGKAGPRFIILL